MSRPGFAHGLGPTPGEYVVFLLWLAVVISSMTAMVLVPAFNLLFWPILWTYDLLTARPPRNSLEPDPDLQPSPPKPSLSLWDRELDG